MNKMSEPKKQPVLGLGDTNVDPDILTKEVDHDFFDNPMGGLKELEKETKQTTCQAEKKDDQEEKFLNKVSYALMGVEKVALSASPSMRTSSEPNCTLIGTRLDHDDFHPLGRMDAAIGMGRNCADSGRSSSNITVQLELGKDGKLEPIGVANQASREDFYSMQSNANYPRPKESYQLQQRRRSFGTIHQPSQVGSSGKKQGQSFHPMNPTDCGLSGHFDDANTSDSSSPTSDDDNNQAADEQDESDSDLSDSSESELESLETDDEEFVDMLEKYFDGIDQDSDYSDLTEVSPLSSLAASPLPPSYFTGIDIGSEYSHDAEQLNIMTDARLCAAANSLQISGVDEDEGVNGDTDDDDHEEARDPGYGLRRAGEIDVTAAAVTAVASAVPAAAQFLERDLKMRGKPRLPVVISEMVIIPTDKDDSDDDNNAPGPLSLSVGGMCGAVLDDTILDNDYSRSGEESPEEETLKHNVDHAEKDPAKGKKELDVCFNCCVMEHAKKILSREASPSRKNGWLGGATQGNDEGNGNIGGNGNNGDDIGRGAFGTGASRSRASWNGKLRAGSSTSATSSSSSTTSTGSSSTNTFGSSASGSSSGGASSTTKRAQKNFTFTPEQMRKIERENHVLLRKILDTHQKGYHGGHGNHCHSHRCRNSSHHHHGHHHQNRSASSSTSIARLRQQKRIEHENTVSFILIINYVICSRWIR